MTALPEPSRIHCRRRHRSLLVAMRPKLHRYCARMTGSVIDGEDVLQDALIKAVEAFAAAGPIGNPEGWLFRIAHNTALDFLRRRNRQEALRSGEEVDMMADQLDAVTSRQIAAQPSHLHAAAGGAALQRDPDGRARLLAARSLRGHGFQPAAAKAALHRGRTQLREMADEPDDAPQPKCRMPIARGLAPMSPISTRAISTPSAP
jgi:RNA polymerase sigma-70 factor (ECF subfamily)